MRASLLPSAQLAVPESAAVAIKALAAGTATPEQQLMAYKFIVYQIAGVDLIEFSMPETAGVMAWRAGRQYVGKQLQNIVATAIQPPAEPPRPARTLMQRRIARELRTLNS